MNNFVVGLDLGQSMDYTALSVVERIPQTELVQVERREGPITVVDTKRVAQPSHYHCRHLARYELGTRYPDIVSKVKAMLQTPALQGAALVIDGTGVGKAVVDMFIAAKLKPIPVTITNGDTAHLVDGYYRMPKRDLVASAVVPLQERRLKFAEDMPLVSTLIQEMMNFKVKITESANDTYGSWRDGQHDDLILSLMLACWVFDRMSKIGTRRPVRSREY